MAYRENPLYLECKKIIDKFALELMMTGDNCQESYGIKWKFGECETLTEFLEKNTEWLVSKLDDFRQWPGLYLAEDEELDDNDRFDIDLDDELKGVFPMYQILHPDRHNELREFLLDQVRAMLKPEAYTKAAKQ